MAVAVFAVVPAAVLVVAPFAGVFAAAVADYRPLNKAEEKIKKKEDTLIRKDLYTLF